MNRLPSWVFAVIALALVGGTAAVGARADAPTLTIVNNASEELLVHVVGPTDGYLAIAAFGNRTATLSRGTYTLYFRWGTTRFRYSKLGTTFTADNGDTFTLTLRSVEGNTPEDPSSEAEFTGRR
jgi:hypothetical protein